MALRESFLFVRQAPRLQIFDSSEVKMFQSFAPSLLLTGSQKNFTSSPTTSLNRRFANLLVPSRSHWLVSHFSPSTSLTIV